jgi:hypothetical protein
MNPEIEALTQQLKAQSEKIDAMYLSIEKLRKYFLLTVWITLATIVLPIIGLAFTAPSFLNTYTSTINAN